MKSGVKWVERNFAFNCPPETFPAILERLRGTPARLEEILTGIPFRITTEKPDGKWSIQENAGHLCEQEYLNMRRLEEFLSGYRILSDELKDDKNREMHEYNKIQMKYLLTRFRILRHHFIWQLELVTSDQVDLRAKHPEFKRIMRLIDSIYFIAEHDDHHLATISGLIRSLSNKL